ncbi:MAG: hypothetical protein WD063_01220 [Pirellulales bacterium]
MNFAPCLQLMWKEYRAVRAFWLSLVVLVVVAQGLIFWLSDDVAGNVAVACNIGLAAPAFFALGCAGAAFAVEREEGTFDFLQAAPVSARQVFTSKLALAAAATLAMFLLLGPLTLAVTRGEMPGPTVLGGMLGLWLLAAVEGLAWGTLFSLLTARPLVAISLALVTTSTIVHLTAWSVADPRVHEVSFAPYLAALPWRGLIAAAVLAADCYLGLRWLDGGGRLARRAKLKLLRTGSQATTEASATDADFVNTLKTRPDRGQMLTHLLWQHWRQSARLMFLMAGLQVALVLLVIGSGVPDRESALVLMAAMAALGGSCVFLADQERRHYGYFVEHNVPPRWVWLTRQLPWIAILFVSTAISCVAWIGPRNIVELGGELYQATNWEFTWPGTWGRPVYVDIPQVMIGLACVAVSYAAGQWASMMIKSGLLAGFFGLVLAGALCGWAFLMFMLRVSWLWSVVPIPFVLFWATWLRAPDWIRENTSWAARLRACAAVLVPALVLVIAVPAYRVFSIPLVNPAFDPAIYHQSAVTPEALATAELYRRANELYVPGPGDPRYEDEPTEFRARVPTPRQLNWLAENAEPLSLVLEASGRRTCCLYDPAKLNDTPWLRNEASLIWLILTSGRQLEAEGKLDLALDRYFAALQAVSHWTEHAPYSRYNFTLPEVKLILSALAEWSAQRGQSTERVRAAFERLRGIDWQMLHLADGVKSNYILARRFLDGDQAAGAVLFGSPNAYEVAFRSFWDRLLPWEKYHELRALNLATNNSLRYFRQLEITLRVGEAVVDFLHERRYWPTFPPFQTYTEINNLSSEAAWELVEIEAHRRATLLLLALQAERMEHGELPRSLDVLVGRYFDKLPHDPYSGFDYLYFPDGLPRPQTPLDTAILEDTPIIPGKPCLWCTGPRLRAETMRRSEPDDESPAASPETIVYYVSNDEYRYPHRLSTYDAWTRGDWFPIAEPQQ